MTRRATRYTYAVRRPDEELGDKTLSTTRRGAVAAAYLSAKHRKNPIEVWRRRYLPGPLGPWALWKVAHPDGKVRSPGPIHLGNPVENRFHVIMFFHKLDMSNLESAQATFDEAKETAMRIGLREGMKGALNFHMEVFDLMARRGCADTWRQDGGGTWRSVHVKGTV